VDLPAPLRGVSRLSWFDPRWAIAVTGLVVEGEEEAELIEAEGVLGRRAIAVVARFRAGGQYRGGSDRHTDRGGGSKHRGLETGAETWN
jgi:hypothetical protein